MTKKRLTMETQHFLAFNSFRNCLMVLRQTLPQDPSTPLFLFYFCCIIMPYFGIAGLVGLLIARNTGFSLAKTVAVYFARLQLILFCTPPFFLPLCECSNRLFSGTFASY